LKKEIEKNEKIPRTAPEEDYLKAAVELEHARNAYDHKKGNKAFDRLMRAAKQIRLTHHDGGAKFFTSLLSHDKPHVVSAAALNLIPFNPKLARKTYERLAKGSPGEVRLDAEITLEEWKAGRLDTEWFMKKKV
jgi:hypothetical protein